MESSLYDQLSSAYDSYIEKPLEIYKKFVDFYSEDNTDFQFPSKEKVWNDFQYKPVAETKAVSTISTLANRTFNSYEESLSIMNMVTGGILPESRFNPTRIVSILKKMYPEIFILIRFPEVTVTNENNKSINIKDLFARVKVNKDGNLIGTFTLNRTSFPTYQWSRGYMHSHVPSMTTRHTPSWENPCLGSGPISTTCGTLNHNSSDEIWDLFIYELSLYVQNESLRGGPYIRLENVMRTVEYRELVKRLVDTPYTSTDDTYTLFKQHYESLLIYSLLKKKLIPFAFQDGSWIIAMDTKTLTLTISNEFISLYNKTFKIPLHILKSTRIIYETVWHNNWFNTFTNNDQESSGVPSINNQSVLTFKKRIVPLNVYQQDMQQEDFESRVITILNPIIVTRICTKLALLANTNYGKSTTIKQTIV